jgi:hypothetical protein
MRRLSLANAPAMAASYGGLPVIGAGRSTGASRDMIASHAAGAAPCSTFRTPHESALGEQGVRYIFLDYGGIRAGHLGDGFVPVLIGH